MKKKNSIVLALAALFVSGLSALASTYYVDASKTDDSGDGASWSTAKKTIQAAVDLTVDGAAWFKPDTTRNFRWMMILIWRIFKKLELSDSFVCVNLKHRKDKKGK